MSMLSSRLIPGGTFFFTIVKYERRPASSRDRRPVSSGSVPRFKRSDETDPFDFVAGVVLPDHLHFVWSLPRGDSNFSGASDA